MNVASLEVFVYHFLALTTVYTWASRHCDFNPKDLFLNCSRRSLLSVPTDDTHFNEARKIDLSFNNISIIRNLTYSNVLQLQVLGLSHNLFLTILELDAFHNLYSLEVLNLSYINISLNPRVLKPEIFKPLHNLQVLRFQDYQNSTYIWRGIDATFSQLKNLKTLYLDLPYEFVFGPGFRALQNLSTISTSGRQRSSHTSNIQRITNETFAVFRDIDIKELRLINCGINSIQSGAFDPLKSLLTLDLGNNIGLGLSTAIQSLHSFEDRTMNEIKLARLNDGFCPKSNNFALHDKDLKQLGKLCIQSLDISENFITYIESPLIELGKLIWCLEKFNVSFHSLRCVPNLFSQDFSLNLNISSLDLSNSYSVPNADDRTRIEYTSPHENYDKGFGIIVPNPTLWPKLKILNLRGISSWTYFDAPVTIHNGGNLKYLNLGFNFLGNCDYSIIRGLSNLIHLDMSGIQCYWIATDYFDGFPVLTHLSLANSPYMDQALRTPRYGSPFVSLALLEDIDLSGNQLVDIHPELFAKNKKLRSINFANNKLQRLPRARWTVRELLLIDLSSNAFTHFLPEEMALLDSLMFQNGRKKTSFKLILKKNSLQCICDTVVFIRWLLERQSFLDDGGSYNCVLFNGSWVNLQTFAEDLANFEQKCVSHPYLIIGVVVGLTSLLLVLLVAVVFRFRLNIRYWLYTKFKPPENMFVDHEYMYDAFVAYTEDDDDWTTNTLCPKLESSLLGDPLQLCVHRRDFLPGKLIHENIVDNMRQSRRILLVVSNAFIGSTWGPLEIEYVVMKSVEQGRDDLILCVLMEDIPVRQMPRTLRNLWSKITFLKWSEELEEQAIFWKNMKQALRK